MCQDTFIVPYNGRAKQLASVQIKSPPLRLRVCRHVGCPCDAWGLKVEHRFMSVRKNQPHIFPLAWSHPLMSLICEPHSHNAHLPRSSTRRGFSQAGLATKELFHKTKNAKKQKTTTTIFVSYFMFPPEFLHRPHTPPHHSTFKESLGLSPPPPISEIDFKGGRQGQKLPPPPTCQQ